jgi:hypothetical protein
MSDNKNFFSTQGAKADGDSSLAWVKPLTVFLGAIAAVEHGESRSKKSPFIRIVVVDVNGPDVTEPSKQFPNAKKPVTTTREYYYSSEGAAGVSSKRLAAFRDVLNIPEMDDKTATCSDVKEMASVLETLLKGKRAYFVNGGREGSDGKVYGNIVDFGFIYPSTPEGKQKAEKYLHDKGDKLIEKYTLPKDGGSSASAEVAASSTADDFDVF